MADNKRKAVLNIVIGVTAQLILIAVGILIPRLVLTHYGSDTNGVLTTISQIFVYVALLEAGIGQATRNALFKPLMGGDKDGVQSVMATSKKYFRKITYIYIALVFVLAAVAPLIINTEMDYVSVALIVLFEGFSNALPFYFTETEKQYINVDGRNYVVSNINLIVKLLMYAVKVVLILVGFDVVAIQFGYFIVSLIQVFIYKLYFKKRYGWINFKSKTDMTLISDRNGYVASEFAWTVFSSTDTIVLSVFVSSSMASVYSVYNMIFSYLSTLLESAYSGITYLLGQAYNQSLEKYCKVHDSIEMMVVMLICMAMSICYFLIIPFVTLYTEGVTDIEYIITSIPILFCLIQILSWSRKVCGNLTALAGYAKPVGRISLIEAISNIVLSLILVNFLGIFGVLLASVVTLLFKSTYLYIFANVKILKRSMFMPLKILLPNLALFGVSVLCTHLITLNITNYLQFFVNAIVIGIAVCLAFILVNVLLHHKFFKLIFQELKKGKKQKQDVQE